MHPPKLLTVAEVAPLLRMTPWQVRELCRAGKLRASKPAGSWLIYADAVTECLEAFSNQREDVA